MLFCLMRVCRSLLTFSERSGPNPTNLKCTTINHTHSAMIKYGTTNGFYKEIHARSCLICYIFTKNLDYLFQRKKSGLNFFLQVCRKHDFTTAMVNIKKSLPLLQLNLCHWINKVSIRRDHKSMMERLHSETGCS